MAELLTNWDTVRQAMTDDAASMLKETKAKALADIENRLIEKGLDDEKTDISGDAVVFITDDKQEFEEGKIYFDEVYEEVSNPSWLESL